MNFYKQFVNEEFNDDRTLKSFSLNYNENFNFGYDVVDELAKVSPDKCCLVWCDKFQKNVHRFNFKDISDMSNRCANFFIDNGVKKGDKVMLLLKRNFEYWYIITALHKIGAIAIPATNTLRTEDLEYRIKSVNISMVVTTDDNCIIPDELDKVDCNSFKKVIVRGNRGNYICFDDVISNYSTKFDRIETNVYDPMILYFTSGTTGEPKPVVHNFTYPLSHIITAKYWQNVNPNGLHFSVSDTGWGKASWGKIYGQWICESAVLVFDYDSFEPKAMMQLIKNFGVTTFCAPPTVFRFFCKKGILDGTFNNVSDIVTAGEAMNPEIAKRFTELTGKRLREGFGQTETTLLIGDLVGQTHKKGSMGKASPFYKLEIMKSDGTFAKDNEQGEIVVVSKSGNNDGIFMSYYNDEKSYADVWTNGVYHTRDIAYRDENGYFYYVSRTDDVIKSCGYRVSPFEVESVLMKHEAVLECAVTGIPDDGRGFRIKATIVLNDGFTGSKRLSNELQRFVLNRTASYKCPKVFDYVSELPKTISGKIRHAEIRKNDMS